MDVWAIFLGAGFGLVLVLGGLSWLINGIQGVWRWFRTRGRSEVVEAQILDRRVTQDHKGDAPPTYYATLRWLYGSGEHTSELQIPERWYQSPEGEPVPIRVHPDRPGKPIIEHWSANPAWKLLGMVFGTIAMVIGVGMLGYVSSGACETYGDTIPVWICDFLPSFNGDRKPHITALMGGRAAGVGCPQDIRNSSIDESAHSLEGVGYWPGYTLHLVDYEIETIEREELKTKLDRGDNFKLVMAMHEWGFRVAHIPGSMHFNTVEEAREGLDLDDEIVVYCTDPACVASQFAYRWLIESGYTNVRRYEGGVSDWAAAGYELESDPASDSSGGAFFLPNRPTADS